MKSLLFITVTLFAQLLLVFPDSLSAAQNEIPHEIGGFILGSNVTDYPEIETSNYLKDVVIYDWHGFDKGIISYGVCAAPGEIIKIKLKYDEPGKKYFNLLLKKYKKKFGKPTEWKGDSFGILHIWKWRFMDKDNNRINLILQHNTKNPNENTGNMVKLYYPDKLAAEQTCFSKHCTQDISDEKKAKILERKKSDWTYLIPK